MTTYKKLLEEMVKREVEEYISKFTKNDDLNMFAHSPELKLEKSVDCIFSCGVYVFDGDEVEGSYKVSGYINLYGGINCREIVDVRKNKEVWSEYEKIREARGITKFHF